ncbi:MAG: EAL domain-containing protein [Acidobacteria bacterium]|nr:EAL domain-containing protein [Acidobacteriota bacterium]
MSSRAKVVCPPERKSSRLGKKSPRLISHLLYDQVTDLPTLPLFLGRIRRELKRRSALGLITLNVIQNQWIEQILGWEAFDALIRDLARCLKQMKPVVLRDEDVVSELIISGNAFVILLAPPRDQKVMTYADMDKVRRRIESHLRPFLTRRLSDLGTQKLELSMGCAILQGGGDAHRIEHSVYQTLDAAFLDAIHQQRREARKETRQLRELLRLGSISTVYQPVVDLEGRLILGYEALSRPERSDFQNPEHLFRVAYACEEVWALERLCRSKAMENLKALEPGQLLFLNIEPESVYDPEMRAQMDGRLLKETGVTPDRIVLEITEHAAVKDFPLFRQALRYFQNQGFQLAMDDVALRTRV